MSRAAVLIAVRSTGNRGWPGGGQRPPMAEARAIVCALINAAKNMISAPTKTMVASTALGTRRASEWLPRRSANSMAGLAELLMLSIPLRSGLDGFFGRIIIPVQPLMLHHIGSNAR